MTLLEHWTNYLRDFQSPDSFIEWSFYSMISSALQRRVWTGPSHVPIYPNLYVVLVGPPATGKTLVVKQVRDILKFHVFAPKNNYLAAKKVSAEEDADLEEVNAEIIGGMKKMLNPPLMIPMAADSTTYEALVLELAKCTRTCQYQKLLVDGTFKTETYFHNSLAFNLTELSNLFKKKVEDIVKYLQETYDCGDYRRTTVGRGDDCIQNTCVNLLAAATPKFIQESLTSELMGEGMSSRIHFVFEHSPRWVRYDIEKLNVGQEESYQVILRRVKELNKVYGNVTMTQECHDFARNFYEVEHQRARTNSSAKLDDYYGRTRLHMDKVAMAIHFSDSNSMVMEVSSMQAAVAALAKVEKKMHLALTYTSKNPLAPVARNILSFLAVDGEKTEGELLIKFYDMLPKAKHDLVEILGNLKEMKQISQTISMTGKASKWKIIDGVEYDDSGIGKKPGNIIPLVGSKTGGEKVAEMLNKYGN